MGQLQHAFLTAVNGQGGPSGLLPAELESGAQSGTKPSAQQESPVRPRMAKKRLSRGASLTRFLPGVGQERKKDVHLDEEDGVSPSESGLRPYRASELSFSAPVAPAISIGTRLRLLAFDFDQTLAATHLFFRLKNQQSRARALRDGRSVPSLVRLLLDRTVPSEEIWGGQARLTELNVRLKELHGLGVFMVIITKGSGRVVDAALQLAGLRDYFKAVLVPKPQWERSS